MTVYTEPYLFNSLLSDLEIRVVDIICYQFEQYQGRDWEHLATGLGFCVLGQLRDKVRLRQGEVDRIDRQCPSLHEKLHVLLNMFILRCKMFGLDLNLIDHLIEVLGSERVFCTPYQILIETILHERLMN